ncbi:MAG: aminodeoxychorismate synthase component I [Acidobacteria bacterium]|nr:aminodeoxychorismate synthase component I [Acidobacteriota bacterium]
MKYSQREFVPTAVFASFKGANPRWDFSFSNPVKIFAAFTNEEVLRALHIVEQETRAGKWGVLMLSYEAATAFDAVMKTHSLHEFPLAWIAIFDKPDDAKVQAEKLAYEVSDWQPQISFEEYRQTIDAIHRHIEAGDTYQINYTFPMQATFSGAALSWFQELGAMQEGEYCAYVNLGRYKTLSLSPELFFERCGTRLITKPMKGTMPRGRWLEEDEAQVEALRSSIKNRAENLMIVDLLRNDLGKISNIGSVEVTKLFAVEKYRTVVQMTSTIESTCAANLGVTEILKALFPCGSITGAPKIRAMQIINELEPSPRRAYTGCIGIVKPGGDCLFNVAIRTIVVDTQTNLADFQVGGGITYDSTAEDEYAECLVKANFLTRQWPEFDLFETMRLEDGEFFLLERHRQRLQKSAAYFDFQFDGEEFYSLLKALRYDYAKGRWRVRVFVHREGALRFEVQEIASFDDRTRRVKFAARPVDSKNIFLYHKTTNRKIYEQALDESSDCDEVILWNEAGEVTEATIANVVIQVGERWWTPPRHCGLLNGTLRDELIATGELREKVIRKDELLRCDALFLINSVRRGMPATLVE